jgi:multiple sugar transport system ATP-binding protein
MNMLKMKVADDGASVVHPDITITVPEQFKAAVAERKGKEVFVGIRPEHIVAPDEHNWTNVADITGKAEIVETLGHEVVVHMSLNNDSKRIVAKMDVHKVPKVGQELKLNVNGDRVHIFDGETQKRL